MIPLRPTLLLAFSLALAGCGGEPDLVSSPRPLRGSPEDSLLRMGDSMRQSGDLSGAANFYMAAIARAPQDATPLLKLGEVQISAGLTDQAEQSFRSALQLAPDNREAGVGLGIALLSHGDPSGALPYLEKAAEDSSDPRVLRNYGVALDMLGRPAQAQATYRRALVHAPADSDLHGNLALSLATSGDMQGAEKEIRAAVNLPNAADHVRANEVVLLAMAGQDGEARAAGKMLTETGRTDALIEQGHRAGAMQDPVARAATLGTITARATTPALPR